MFTEENRKAYKQRAKEKRQRERKAFLKAVHSFDSAMKKGHRPDYEFPKYLRTTYAAIMLKCTTQTVRNYLRKGKLRGRKFKWYSEFQVETESIFDYAREKYAK